VDEEGKNAASIGEDAGGKTVEGLEVKGSVKVFEVENFGESLYVCVLWETGRMGGAALKKPSSRS
jgi:hypothetical protein